MGRSRPGSGYPAAGAEYGVQEIRAVKRPDAGALEVSRWPSIEIYALGQMSSCSVINAGFRQ